MERNRYLPGAMSHFSTCHCGLSAWDREAGGRQQHRGTEVSAALQCLLHLGFLQSFAQKPVFQKDGEQWHLSCTCLTPVPHAFSPQASQLGVYRAFVDNYGVAMETAEKCCQANAQFAEISEVCMMLFRKVHPSPPAGGPWAGC